MILPGLRWVASRGTDARPAAARSGSACSPRVTTYAPKRMSAPPAKVNASNGSRRKRKDRTAATSTSSRIRSPETVGEIVRLLATYNRRGVQVGAGPAEAIPSPRIHFYGGGQQLKETKTGDTSR